MLLRASGPDYHEEIRSKCRWWVQCAEIEEGEGVDPQFNGDVVEEGLENWWRVRGKGWEFLACREGVVWVSLLGEVGLLDLEVPG